MFAVIAMSDAAASTRSMLLDKTAISLSSVCALHCLLLPVGLALLPPLATMPFGHESFHQVLIFLILPLSLIALTLGCKRHRQWQVFAVGLVGCGVLLIIAAVGHDFMGETVEKVATVIGSCLVAVGHLINFRRCRQIDCEH